MRVSNCNERNISYDQTRSAYYRLELGISVRIIAREGDEIAESVRRHRNDEREREVYLCVYFYKVA